MKVTRLGCALGGAVDFVSRKMAWLSAAAVLAVFVLVVVDVFGRYFFNHPVKGSNDIGELTLVLVAYFAMAFTQLNKEHVRVTLVWSKLPPKGKLIGDGIAFLFGAVVYALISWNLAVRAWRLIAGTYPSSSQSPVLGIPHIPFVIVAVVGGVAFTLALMADSVRAWAKLAQPTEPPKQSALQSSGDEPAPDEPVSN